MVAEKTTDTSLTTERESFIERRNQLLKDIAPETIRGAWFTLSHLLLTDGAKVIDMGCDDGSMTYAMAAMNPKVKFTGIDKNKRQINKAKEKYELHNLEFKAADASTDIFDPESVDAIINSYCLHEIFSGSRYNEQIVRDTLATHFKMLRKGGTMFIRDYSRPPPGEYVLLEMPDAPSKGSDLARLSEADLLVWYSEHARPRQDPGCGGFFLEELPGRFPKTRLFHLPYKWAYEFLMRKDDRSHWETELPMEYTFFTPREFRKQLRDLGARVQYSGPYWDEDYIDEKFEGRFRLYSAAGAPLGMPPTCFIAVAVKMAERKSLNIEERRPSASGENKLKISAVRSEKTGQILDIVSRDLQISEIIPYRVDEEGRLKIYLHDGVPRSIVNAVPRKGVNIDGRHWSGHMVEAVSVDAEGMSTMQEFDVKHSVRFARDYLGLKPRDNAILEKGPDYYPAPTYIDDRIYTFYLSVEESKNPLPPKAFVDYSLRFQARGQVREMDAQQILNAITVGMIPNARLEMQILSLFQHLNILPETWTSKHISMQYGKIPQKTTLKDVLKELQEDYKFKDMKGTAGQLRPVHSTFVEEGQTRGAIAGLSSQDVDFVVHDGQSINTAVVLPITKGLKGDVHAGFLIQHLPVPARHEGSGATISAPSFTIPPEITNMKMLKKFIADQYGISPKMVMKLGESYFSHIGMTPQRIHPFAVAVPPGKAKDPHTKFLPFYQFKLLRRSLGKDPHFMLVISRAYRYLHADIKLDFDRRVQAIVKERFSQIQPDWSMPLNYAIAPGSGAGARPESTPYTDLDLDKDRLDAQIRARHDLERERLEPRLEEIIEQPEASPIITDEIVEEFEQELEEFIEALDDVNEHHHKPQPEKW